MSFLCRLDHPLERMTAYHEGFGLYLHVPFCNSKCGYCDFYSVTQTELRTAYVKALLREMREEAHFAGDLPLRTIYFGGGTPSLLEMRELERIFNEIDRLFHTSDCLEITLEANPDDLNKSFVNHLRRLPINRLSLGIQSFNDRELSFVGRRHTAQQAIEAFKNCRAAGFDNISLDLMFGLPQQSLDSFSESLQQACRLHPEHISAYLLGLEEHVPLYLSLKQGEWATDDDSNALMYARLQEHLATAGYEQYEISNFSLPGKQSVHNSAYWQGRPYLGLGPSAHSFRKGERRWNKASLPAYLSGRFERESESLGLAERFNDYIMTRLRCSTGIDWQEMTEEFGQEAVKRCQQAARQYIKRHQLVDNGQSMSLHPQAYFISDGIIRDLMMV